jgi:hypothetical protein
MSFLLLLAGSTAFTIEMNVVSCASRSLFDGGVCFETRLNVPFVDLVAEACELRWGVGCFRRSFTVEVPEWTNGTGLASGERATLLRASTFDVSAFRLAYDCHDAPCVTRHGGPAVDASGVPVNGTNYADGGRGLFLAEALRMTVLPASSGSLATYIRQLEATMAGSTGDPNTDEHCTATVLGCAWAGSIGVAVGHACDCLVQKLAYQMARAVHDAANPTASAEPEQACTVTVVGCAWAGAIGVEVGGACDCAAAQRDAYATAKAMHDLANPTLAPGKSFGFSDGSRFPRLVARALAERGA